MAKVIQCDVCKNIIPQFETHEYRIANLYLNCGQHVQLCTECNKKLLTFLHWDTREEK